MFTHLDHLIVAVDDLEAAAKNYQTLFGMTQVLEWRTQRAWNQQRTICFQKYLF